MATKDEWLEHLKAVEKYARDLKKWVKKLPTGEVTATGPGSNPPPPPPPPPK